MFHRSLSGLFFACAFVVSIGACSSSSSNKIETKACSEGQKQCSTAQDCDDPARSICSHGCCEVTTRACTSSADCCPGQTCTSLGRCSDQYTECSSDSDCGTTGDRFCLDWIDPNFGTTQRCNYKPCGTDSACTEPGQTCFAGVCVASAPCGGSCGEGEACVLATNTCHPAMACDPSIFENVAAGSLVVFTDLGNVYDACISAELSCSVVELPPIEPADLGRHSSLAINPKTNEILVSMYDGTHGDLVIRTFNVNGKVTSTHWVDGVPEEAPITGSITGPRGGVSEPGPDVGQYSTLTTVRSGNGAGRAFVAYYGVTDKSLHFISRDEEGNFGTPHIVDGGASSGDVGRYASIALSTEGSEQRPAIAYFQKSGGTDTVCNGISTSDASASRMTALKFARAKKALPAAASDWTIETVACLVLPQPPCDGCPLSCVLDTSSTNGTRCITATSDCLDANGKSVCSSSQLCENGMCLSKGSAATSLKQFPEGVGLFPSLAFQEASSAPYIAWYDQQRGNLMLSKREGSSWESKLIDGEITSGNDAGKDTGNVGLYPSLVFDKQNAGAATLAYYDATRHGLRYLTATLATQLAPVDPLHPSDAEFIDRGLGSGESFTPQARVGADVVLVSTIDALYAAYQDATSSDLILRERAADGTWKLLQRWSDGAVGFYAGMGFYGNALYVGSAQLKTISIRGKPKIAHQYRLFQHILASSDAEEDEGAGE